MTIIVESDKELDDICIYLKSCEKVGVDVEGDGMYHFKEKICLLQLSDGENDWVIDTLKVNNVSKLSSFFFDPSVKKIFHGADYDIKSLYRDYGIVVNNIFDTEIASRFAGLKFSGLDNILLSFLGVETEKKYQKKDWSVRPLSEEMLEYAAMDAHYLISLTDILKEKLKKLGRLNWVYEESSKISESRFIKKCERPYFTSFKGAGRLDSRSLAILEGLLKFRYGIARKKDKPLYKILPNKLIINLAEKKTSSENEIKTIMTPGHYKRFGRQVISIVQRAMDIPSSSLPKYPKAKRERSFDHRAAIRAKKLREWRQEKAGELDLDIGLVLNNSLLAEIAENNPESLQELMGVTSIKYWQKKEFGEEILNLIKRI